MLLGLLASLAAGLLYGVAAVGQATAARRLPPPSEGAVAMLRAGLRDPLLMGMAGAYLLGALLHLVAIENAPLYIAQTGIAAALPVTAITSAIALKEPLELRDWLAVASTFAGITVLAVDAGHAGTTTAAHGFTVGLYISLGLIAALALIAYRHWGRPSAVALSLLGGLCYSATTLAARVLGDEGWSWLTPVLALIVVASGLLGFWLYSFAMQRLSVAAASAPLILAEVLVPTIVGVTLLGDEVPTVWAVVLGLVLALAGATYLAGFEGRVLEPGTVHEGDDQDADAPDTDSTQAPA